MANLTQSRDDDRQEGVLVDIPHNGNKIYGGAIVTVNTDGYAKAGASGEAVIGVAAEETPATDNIRVYAEGVFQFDGKGFTQADTGKLVVVGDDDHSVAIADDTAKSNEIVGKIINVISSTSVRVKL